VIGLRRNHRSNSPEYAREPGNGYWNTDMNVFDLRDRLVGDYASYTRSFIKIADTRISDKVDSELKSGAFWPEPLLQLNPTFLPHAPYTGSQESHSKT